jgi:hypothetical protein
MKQYVIGLQQVLTYAKRLKADDISFVTYRAAPSKSMIIHVCTINIGVQHTKNSNTTANNILMTLFFDALLLSLFVCLIPLWTSNLSLGLGVGTTSGLFVDPVVSEIYKKFSYIKYS